MSTSDVTYQDEIVTRAGARKALAFARIIVGFYFFWACIDKVFGFGFLTATEDAVIHGGHPAQEFIVNTTEGTVFSGFFSIFLNPFMDWLFLIGLLAIGLALLLGMGMKVAGVAGSVLMFLMWLAEFPLIQEEATNPIIDDHWFLAAIFAILTLTRAGDTWGLGRWWASKVGESWLR